MLVEKSSWNCASPALRFDWFNADDAVERTANGIEIGYGRGQQREQERGMGNSARGTGTGTGTTGRAAEWGEHVPFGVARCQIWLRSVFQQQQQQQQIELIVKEMLAKNLWHDGGGAGTSLCTAAAAARINFASKVAFTFCGHPFSHLPLSSVLQICATRICFSFLFLFLFFLRFVFPIFSFRSFFYTAIGVFSGISFSHG